MGIYLISLHTYLLVFHVVQLQPYFPRGGPQPSSLPNRHAHHIMGYVSQWGGMDVGSGMLFAAESIDGLVHQLGGLHLRAECSLVPTHQYSYAYINQQSELYDSNVQDDEKRSAKCPVGTAVATSSGGIELQKHYDTIIHTTPPFYNYPPSITPELKEALGIDIDSDDDSSIHSWSKELLKSCYRQSFKAAFDNNSNNDTGIQNSFISNSLSLFGLNNKQHIGKTGKRVALPLLGAGCRAFPKEIALDVAAIESASWLHSSDGSEEENTDEDEIDVVAFGLLEEEDARHLSDRLEKELCVPQPPAPTS